MFCLKKKFEMQSEMDNAESMRPTVSIEASQNAPKGKNFIFFFLRSVFVYGHWICFLVSTVNLKEERNFPFRIKIIF